MVITLSVIIWWILIGLVVGAVARLVIPGRHHIGIIVTILIGIVAAIVGRILTAALLGAGHTIITFIVAVLLAAQPRGRSSSSARHRATTGKSTRLHSRHRCTSYAV